jgi:hypothetical protein
MLLDLVNDNRHLVAVKKSAPAFLCGTLMQWSFLMEGLKRHLSRQREVISTVVLSIVKRISVVSHHSPRSLISALVSKPITISAMTFPVPKLMLIPHGP